MLCANIVQMGGEVRDMSWCHQQIYVIARVLKTKKNKWENSDGAMVSWLTLLWYEEWLRLETSPCGWQIDFLETTTGVQTLPCLQSEAGKGAGLVSILSTNLKKTDSLENIDKFSSAFNHTTKGTWTSVLITGLKLCPTHCYCLLSWKEWALAARLARSLSHTGDLN